MMKVDRDDFSLLIHCIVNVAAGAVHVLVSASARFFLLANIRDSGLKCLYGSFNGLSIVGM